jgi:hypothetical protein
MTSYTLARSNEPTDERTEIASPPAGPNLGNMTEGNKPKGIGRSDSVNIQ